MHDQSYLPISNQNNDKSTSFYNKKMDKENASSSIPINPRHQLIPRGNT